MRPRSTKDPIQPEPHLGDRAEFPYGINARLGERHAQYLNGLRRDQGIGTSAAVRAAIERAMAREEEEPVSLAFSTGVLASVTFVGVPELGDHIEMHVRQVEDDDSPTGTEWGVNIDVKIAREWIEQLTAAVEAVEDAGTDG